jgi:hypothetical protein
MICRLGTLASITMLLALGGCATSPIVGTWTGRGAGDDAPFTFGSVSFVGDKTFTAEARYGGETRVTSGTWTSGNGELTLHSGDTARHYNYSVAGTELTVTDPKSGNSLTLDRLNR